MVTMDSAAVLRPRMLAWGLIAGGIDCRVNINISCGLDCKNVFMSAIFCDLLFLCMCRECFDVKIKCLSSVVRFDLSELCAYTCWFLSLNCAIAVGCIRSLSISIKTIYAWLGFETIGMDLFETCMLEVAVWSQARRLYLYWRLNLSSWRSFFWCGWSDVFITLDGVMANAWSGFVFGISGFPRLVLLMLMLNLQNQMS